jgi:predicted permease
VILSWLYQTLARVVSLFSKSSHERHLEEELDIHIELATEENIRRGIPPDAARREAILKLGSRDSVKELHRETRSLPFFENLVQDLGYGARQLRRNPLVTFTVIATLSIAIGANTTVFSFANALLFREPLGVAEPDRLVDIGVSHKGIGFASTSYPNYRDIAERTTTLEGVYAHPRFPRSMKLTMPGGAVERVFVTDVSTNYFRVLGAIPTAGRFFDRTDETNDPAVAVLNYGFWTRRFNRDPRVVGQTVRLNDSIVTIVGVASDGFIGTGIRAADMWLPLRPNPTRSAAWLLVGGRLKLGVSMEQAATELKSVGRALRSDYPLDNRDKDLRLAPLSPLPGETRPVGGFLGLLMGIVVVVLAIACANVSGVLLARAAARHQEIAVRLAIGAKRRRIIRQLLTETVLLFVLSAVVGLMLARVLTSILVSQLPALPFPVDISVSLDSRVVAFAMFVSFAAALLSGLAPALQVSKGDMVSALKNQAPRPLGGLRLRNAFVFAQVALSLLLVAVGGLFARALETVRYIDPGFDAGGVELASLDFSATTYDKITGASFARELLGRVRNIPRVEAATIATVLPGGFEGIGLGGISVPGVTPPDGAAWFSATWNVIEPGYFATLHMPLLDGRDFNANDRNGTQPVVILGEGATRKFWPGQSAVGKYIEQWGWGPGPQMALQKRLLVVGVARDPKFGSLVDGSSGIYVYLPVQQEHLQVWTMIAARSTDGRRLTEELRAVVAAMDANVAISSAQTAEEYASLGLAPWRIAASVAGSLGIVGMLLAAIGIYGVTAYVVTRRTKEIGVRIALGAQRTNVIGIVLRQGMSVVGAGVATGLIFALAAGRLLVAFLFGVSGADPIVFSSAIALFAMIDLAACYIPARRATRIDPISVLRNE